MKKTILVLMLLLAVVTLAANPASRITSKCTLYFQLDRVEDAVGQIAGYAAYFGQQLTGQALLAQLSTQVFGQAGFPGINLGRPVGIYLYSFTTPASLPGAGQRPEIAVSVPVSDPALFRQVVVPRLMMLGLSSFTEGDRVILYTSPAALGEYRSGRRIKAHLGNDAHLSVYMNFEILRASIMGMIDQLKGLPKGGSLGPLFSILMDIYRGMLDESRSVSYSLALREQGVEIGFAMEYMPGSRLAALMGAGKPSALPALAVLPVSSLAAFGSASDPDSSGKYLMDLLGKFANYPEIQDFIRPVIRQLMDNAAGESAVAFLPSPGIGFSIAVVNQVKSAASSRAFLAALEAKINSLPFLQKAAQKGAALKMVYRKNARTVAGQDVDTFQLEIQSREPIPEQQRAMVEVLLRLFTANIVYANGYQLMVFGDTPDRFLQEMIRNSAAPEGGFKTSAAWRKANRAYGKYPKNGFFYLSLQGFIKEILELAKPFLGAKAGMAESFNIPGAFYGYTFSSTGKVEAVFLLEREVVAGIAKLASMMMPKQGMDKNPSPDGNDK